MKIAYVVTRAEPMGGAQVHVRDLALALRREGHEITVLTGDAGRFTTELGEHGVPWIVIPDLQLPIHIPADLRAFYHLRTTLRRLKPDLVSTHSSKAGVLGRLAARSLRLPVIFTAHGWAFTPGKPARVAWLYRTVERLVAPLATRIITVSDFDRRLAISLGVARSDRVVAVHNGMPDVAPELRANPRGEPVRFAMVARFEAQKDHGTLLEALAGLPEREWTLDLIGDGPLLPAARALAERLGIATRVCFRGQRSDVAELLAEAQVFVLASRWEGLPRSILEAMRAGLPVVASDVGGVRESVHDGITGFVVPRGKSPLFRRRLEELLVEPELRGRMGALGRELYERRFRLEYTVASTLAVYREAVFLHQGSMKPVVLEEP